METKAKIEKLFHAGLLPGAAHKDLIRQLRSECGSVLEFEERLADRSVIPRKPDMNRLYGLFTKEIFGNNSIENMFATLEARIDQLMESGIIYSSKLQKFDEKTSQPLILVVVTPLMKRVHEMVQNAKDLIFVDSSSNMEEFNLRVFIVVTHSVCGALPLGIIFTSDEQGKTLQTAFELYKETVSPYGFYGSLTGPSVVMTDNCDELRDALLSIWPNITLLLCIYHILQQVWRWVHDSKHGISLQHRPHILTLFKRVLYANTIDDMEEEYSECLSDEIVSSYPNLL